MISERMQRRVDRLLDEAEEAADAKNWSVVRELVNEVLALDPNNVDTPGLLRAAARVAGTADAGSISSDADVAFAEAPAPSHPSSFVAGRYRITQQGSLVGTAAYMPPEQALGGEVTPQFDLYALGAMLYELITGRPPFAGDDPTAVISQHINTPPVAPSWHTEHCPPSLEALILAMLQKDATERPESADAVLRLLDAVDPNEQSARHSDSDANPRRRPRSRRIRGPRESARQAALDHIKGAPAFRLDLVEEAERWYQAGHDWAVREGCPIDQGRSYQGLAEVAMRRQNVSEAMEPPGCGCRPFGAARRKALPRPGHHKEARTPGRRRR